MKAPSHAARPWGDMVLYQIYPRSFADSDGDGVGDLQGIIDRIGHLESLGVDGVWLSPIMRSPGVDHGYDVSDPRDVDPLFGDVDALRRLADALHSRRMVLIMDLVPNHTSSEHPWFVEALAAEPGSPQRARYFFRDGRGPDGSEPPNNWPSVCGGPAWARVTEPDGTPGQWYLHLFAPQQPDLDWSNPEIADDLEHTLRFWLDRGVDGFRIDVAHGLAKPDQLENLPDDLEIAQLVVDPRDARWDRPGVHAVHRRIRKVVDDYPGATTFGEVWIGPVDRFAKYLRPDELHFAFHFALTGSPFEAGAIRTAIDDHAAEVAAITATTDAPTVENTVIALERSGQALHRVLSVFYGLLGPDATPTRLDVERVVSPLLAAHHSAVMTDPVLYARVAEVYTTLEAGEFEVDDETDRLIRRHHRDLLRAGAALDEAGRARLTAIDTRLAELTTKFGENLLASTTELAVPVTEEARKEAYNMLPSANLFKPGTGAPGKLIHGLSLEYISGLYLLTKDVELKGEATNYGAYGDMYRDYLDKNVPYDTTVMFEGVKSSLGKHLINGLLPKEMRKYDSRWTKSEINKAFLQLAKDDPGTYVEVSNKLKELGRIAAYRIGIGMGIEDLVNTGNLKARIMDRIDAAERIEDDDARAKVLTDLAAELEDIIVDEAPNLADENAFYKMFVSGAKGSPGQVKQILEAPIAVADTFGDTVPIPIKRGYAEGLSPAELALTGVRPVADLRAALLANVAGHRRLAVIPEGPYVLPFVAGEGPAGVPGGQSRIGNS